MRNGFICLISILVLSLITVSQAFSQIQTTNPADTSYFLPFDYDFNLILAADRGELEHVSLMLSRGADINAVTYEGVTALMYASDNGNIEMVRYLLQKGADPDMKPYNGLTALMSAARNNHFEAAELLAVNSQNINLQDIYGVTALHYAAAFNRFEVADMLIFYGADPDIQDNYGNTALITSAFNNCYDAVEILIHHGADLNKTDNKSYTALMGAIQEGNAEIVKLLIENGADIHHTGPTGISAIIVAIRKQDILMVEKLFSLGAEINEERGRSVDVLELAISTRNKEMTDILKSHNVKPLLRPNFNRLVLGPAISFNSSDFKNGILTGILDSKYNAGIYGGFLFRPSAVRVLNQPAADTIFQYWERRYLFHLGLEKRFALFSDHQTRQNGPFLGVNQGITYGSYRGSGQKPVTRLITIPQVGWYYSGKYLLIKANYEFVNFNTPDIKPGRFNLSVSYAFQLKKKVMATKSIFWLE